MVAGMVWRSFVARWGRRMMGCWCIDVCIARISCGLLVNSDINFIRDTFNVSVVAKF